MREFPVETISNARTRTVSNFETNQKEKQRFDDVFV